MVQTFSTVVHAVYVLYIVVVQYVGINFETEVFLVHQLAFFSLLCAPSVMVSEPTKIAPPDFDSRLQ